MSTQTAPDLPTLSGGRGSASDMRDSLPTVAGSAPAPNLSTRTFAGMTPSKPAEPVPGRLQKKARASR
jgi:hypothetical protein